MLALLSLIPVGLGLFLLAFGVPGRPFLAPRPRNLGVVGIAAVLLGPVAQPAAAIHEGHRSARARARGASRSCTTRCAAGSPGRAHLLERAAGTRGDRPADRDGEVHERMVP